MILFGLAALLYLLSSRFLSADIDVYFSLTILAVVLCWMAAFLMIYGDRAFRQAAFPVLLLILMVPLPGSVLQMIIHALQQWSADLSYVFFSMAGVPVFRDGFFFTLPGLTIEVAEQCSGIRSSTALVIVVLLIGQLWLRFSYSKLILLAIILPILIFKNAVRIVTLSLLSVYVSRDFLDGPLHHSGGVVFFLLGLLMLAPAVRLLEISENRRLIAVSAVEGKAGS